jgi:hypothetical protein
MFIVCVVHTTLLYSHFVLQIKIVHAVLQAMITLQQPSSNSI